MICNVIDKDYYILKVYNEYFDFDIYNHDEVRGFIEKLFDKILKKYNINGNILFDIYIDRLYGMIIEVKKDSNLMFNNFIDVKIKFNLNISFLYQVDYFYAIENNLGNQNIYYYNGKYYLELINDIDKKDYLYLLDNCIIIYDDDVNKIINEGIRLKI